MGAANPKSLITHALQHEADKHKQRHDIQMEHARQQEAGRRAREAQRQATLAERQHVTHVASTSTTEQQTTPYRMPPSTTHRRKTTPIVAAANAQAAPASTEHTFTDVLEDSLKNKTVMVSSISGAIVGLVAGGDNRILVGLLGASAPLIAHILIEMQPKKPKLIQAHAGTFKVTKSQIIQIDDGHY